MVIKQRDEGNGQEKRIRELALGTWFSQLIPSSNFGILVALYMWVISMEPTLLPKNWLWKGICSGILTFGGYVLGALVAKFLRWVWKAGHVQITANRVFLQRIVPVIALLLILEMGTRLWTFYGQTRDQAKEIGVSTLTPGSFLLSILVALLVFIALTAIIKSIAWLWRFVVAHSPKSFSRWVKIGIATFLVVPTVVISINDFLFESSMEYVDQKFAISDKKTPDDVDQPMETTRSGSPDSLSRWEDLGAQGKRFLAGGPRADKIAEVTGQEATEPIRIYSGLNKERDLKKSAELAVAEMKRTEAFCRPVVVLATSTGTGWLDEWQVAPVEYFTKGNSAIVSMQYSNVPSVIAFLRELEAPVEAGTILYQTVMEEVNRLPEGQRPAIYLAGNSLGSFGSQGAFSDKQEVLDGVAGALWAGTPHNTPLWRSLTEQRHKGSPEVAPVVDNGFNFRFANNSGQLTVDAFGRQLPEWQFPRIVYSQQTTDPVVWWHPGLLLNEPDWLREPTGEGVPSAMHWRRGATFFQITTDLPLAGQAPSGYGHTYTEEMVPMWLAILGLDSEPGKNNPYRDADSSWIDDAMVEKISKAV